jgi:putative transposase
MQKAYKYRIYPSKDSQQHLEQTFGCTRKVWNLALAKQNQAHYDRIVLINSTRPAPWMMDGVACRWDFVDRQYEADIPVTYYNYNQAAKDLTHLKQLDEYNYLNEVSSVSLQQKLMDLGKAYKAMGNQASSPKFKSKHGKQSFRLTSGAFQLRDGKLIIKGHPIKVNWSRELPSSPSQVTISKLPSGEYYASFLCEYQPIPTNGQGIIGIDMGLKTLASIYDGTNHTAIANPRHYVKAQRKLARLQRKLSRKTKGSKNRIKAKIKVAKQHQTIANQRSDHLHKLTSKLISDNQAICIEDLNVKGMSANHCLSKHVMDAGMGMFKGMLRYKAIQSSHCNLLIADRWFPSTQLCSGCGNKPDKRIKLGVSSWTCPTCLITHDRDENAATNLYQLAVDERATWLQQQGHIFLMKPYSSKGITVRV